MRLAIPGAVCCLDEPRLLTPNCAIPARLPRQALLMVDEMI